MAFDAKAVLRLGDKGSSLRKGDRIRFDGEVLMQYGEFTEVMIDEGSIELLRPFLKAGDKVDVPDIGDAEVIGVWGDYAWVTTPNKPYPISVQCSKLRRL